MNKEKLVCTNCGESYDKETKNFRCDKCGEPIELEEVKEGKISDGNPLGQTLLERYKDFYPSLSTENNFSLNEGFTSLVSVDDMAKEYGISGLFFKNETQNPTWSFKDRGTVTGVLRAMNLGYKKIGTVSTGNMATSVAAYGARAGLDTYILVKKGIAEEKLKPIAIYGAKLIEVEGDYSKLYDESLAIGHENDIYFINSDVPYRVEGYKTMAFEICEQLGFEAPDYVIVPTSAGGDIRGIEKGFREFYKLGLIDKLPKMVAVQASGCSPIYNAFREGKLEISRVADPETIAHAIENPYPPSGNQVLRMLKKNGGLALGVDDVDILKSQKKLASLGLFVQPASATSLAAVEKLYKEKLLKESDNVVCVLTGSGLKYTAALDEHDLDVYTCKLEELNDFIKKVGN
ncbi:MAG: threonine synthase [Tissierellaceae bacterium]|jgi:threonine synthase|nr:threonine synthase [Tissierellia bacterium]